MNPILENFSIVENFPFFLQLSEVICETTANPKETMTQSCAEKYEGFFCTLPHEVWISITKVMNDFTGSENP